VITHRILLVSACPSNEERLALDRDERAIRECFKRCANPRQFAITTCPAATVNDFRRGLLEWPGDGDVAQRIVHFAGHGSDNGMVFVDENNVAYETDPGALCRELEEARYDASLAARRYEVVDPTKRLVARELETRWNAALECVAGLEDRIARHDDTVARRPKVDRAALMALAHDLPFTWNAPGTDTPSRDGVLLRCSAEPCLSLILTGSTDEREPRSLTITASRLLPCSESHPVTRRPQKLTNAVRRITRNFSTRRV